MFWIFLISAIVILSFGIGAFIGAPWVPAFEQDFDELLTKAKVGKGTKFIDLGCGNGKVLEAAAKRGADVTGYEINPVLWLVSWWRVRSYPNASVWFGNMWGVHLDHYDIVFLFLIHHHMPRMARKLSHSLKPDARVISYVYEFPGVKPTIKTRNSFLYRAKAFGTIESKVLPKKISGLQKTKSKPTK